MSVNTAHANNGVLLHAGEAILLFSDNVTMEFSGQDHQIFKGTKHGRIFLTTHRMIFNAKNLNSSDGLKSFSSPFVAMSDVDIEQPVFGANYIKGKIRSQENGGFIGEVKFKLLFKSGGAIDFGQAMLKAAYMAKQNANNASPPPYQPPTGDWYQAPPPAYTPNPGVYGWMPNTQSFQGGYDPNGVYMTDNPPPYSGIYPSVPPQPNYPNYAPQGGAGFASGYQNVPPNYPPTANVGYQQSPNPQPWPQQPGGPPNYPGSSASAPGYPGAAASGYPGAAASGYPGAAAAPGYPGSAPGGFPNGGPSGAMGWNMGGPQAPQAGGFANPKEQEAAQSAYYDPSRPQTAYVPPPPAYYEPPPSYNSLNQKKSQ